MSFSCLIVRFIHDVIIYTSNFNNFEETVIYTDHKGQKSEDNVVYASELDVFKRHVLTMIRPIYPIFKFFRYRISEMANDN